MLGGPAPLGLRGAVQRSGSTLETCPLKAIARQLESTRRPETSKSVKMAAPAERELLPEQGLGVGGWSRGARGPVGPHTQAEHRPRRAVPPQQGRAVAGTAGRVRVCTNGTPSFRDRQSLP